jgi:Tfp pilus assembly protein PilX
MTFLWFNLHLIIAMILVVGLVFINRQLAAIHELVNSNLTKSQAALAIAETRIRYLEQHIANEPNARSEEEERRTK